MNKQAILLSGGVNNENNYPRYGNDLELAYMALKNAEGFSDDNIALLFGNGLKSLGLGRVKTQAATKKNLIGYMKRAEKILAEDDEFVMAVSNHGGDDGVIFLWGCEYIEHAELAWHFNRIKAKKIIVLGECFGGDFLKYDIGKSCIFTANDAGMESYAHVNNVIDFIRENYNFDEFFYHFFSFLLGKYPDTGIRIPKGCNNLGAAYEYAKANDIFNPSNKKTERIRSAIEEGVMEVPQMKNNLMDRIIRL